MSNTSKDESKSESVLPSQSKPTDEVRPDIKAAPQPMETANFNKGEAGKTMEIRNDSAD
jgi:hypothetical protein